MADDTADAAVDDALRRLFEAARREAADAAPDDAPAVLDAAVEMVVVEGEVDRVEGPAVAVRSALIAPDEQLLVRGGWSDVIVDVAPSSDDGTLRDVRGTVLDVEEVCAVQLLAAGREIALAVTDVFGDFSLQGVAPGRYALVVAASRAELTAELHIR